MFPFALPGPTIEIEATLVLGAVVVPIAVPPTVISGVVLGATGTNTYATATDRWSKSAVKLKYHIRDQHCAWDQALSSTTTNAAKW